MSSTTTFHFDDTTEETLAELKAQFNVKTKAQVIRKALALASIIQAHKSADNTVLIGENKKAVKVLLD